ncbi:MAG: hypothetical protein IJH77_02930 [Mogibacterium sp.]|nr:hypothetical protein [Mogibacterium sp.]
MKRFRDFYHDTNDILIALVIIAAAAVMIVWRIGIILDYPAQIAKENASHSQQAVTAEVVTPEDAAAEQDTGEAEEDGSAEDTAPESEDAQ